MSTIARITAPILLILAAYQRRHQRRRLDHRDPGRRPTEPREHPMASARHQRALARTAGTTPQALYPPPQHRLPPLHSIPCCRSLGPLISRASPRLPIHTHMRHVRTPADEFAVRHSRGVSRPHGGPPLPLLTTQAHRDALLAVC